MKKRLIMSLVSVAILSGAYILFTSLKKDTKKAKEPEVVNQSVNERLRNIGFDLFPSNDEVVKKNKYAKLGLRYVTQVEIEKIIDSHRLTQYPYTVTWTTYPSSEYRGNIPEDIKAKIVNNYELIKDDIVDEYKVRILGPVQREERDPIAYVFIKGGGYVFLAEWE